MRKPAKRPAKRAAPPSPALPENSPDLPTIPRRYSRHSVETLERRIDAIERALPPAPADDWYRAGDPSQRIRFLLAAARGHLVSGERPAAANLLAEAERLFWDNQPRIRADRQLGELRTVKARRQAASDAATQGKQEKAAERAEDGRWWDISVEVRQNAPHLKWNSFLVKAVGAIDRRIRKEGLELKAPSKNTLGSYLRAHGLT